MAVKRETKVKIGLRGKILIPFLALVFVSLGIISALALQSIYEVGYLAKQDSITMGETVVRKSIAALEDLGRRLIQRRALHVAEELELFIELHPELEISEWREDEEVMKIAVQQVGHTGHTMVYDSSYSVHFHSNPKMVGNNLHNVAGEPTHFWPIMERSLGGEASGYYDWEDPEGNVRKKYMYCIPVEGTELVVAASTYIDEFSAPLDETKADIASAVSATSQYIDEQMEKAQLTFIVIIFGVILIAGAVIFLLSRAITRPILALTEGAEVIGKGELDYSIKADTGDEIQQLAEQFNAMARALKESYSNLEQKVEERTKQERQRAEQLRTINEVSRKISSFVNLDELIPYVGNILRQTFHYHNVNIFLFEPGSGKLTLKALSVSGQKGFISVGVPLEVDEDGIVGWVARTGEPLLASDVDKEPRYRAVEALSDTKSELAVAVKIGEKVLGVLDIESTEVDAFGEADLFTAQTIADQLAVAIENARLYEETGQMAVMEERNRMAREIHDTLAQGFTGIILQLEAAEQALDENSPELERHLNQAGGLARKSLAEARRSVWNLRPQALEQLPLPEALRREIERLAQETGVDARFVVSGDRRDLLAEVEAGLLRICQESLANVTKHAKASEVRVDLAFAEAAITLSIIDNGVGFRPGTLSKTSKKRRGFGLISMQERARGLGGTFELQTGKGKGTLVRVTIPTEQEV